MADYDVYDHRDIQFQATCLDLDFKNEKLILAGKRCIAVTKATDPENAEQKYFRRNKFDVTCIKWCPHADNRQQIAATSSQFFELYNLRSTGIQILSTSRAHSRNITDLDWDRFNSYQFATCSVDDSVNVWDVRDLKKPSLSLSIVAGAVQVKWCKLLEYIFATAHEGDIRVWDIRKGSVPVQFIAAHLAKILSFDWHPRNDVTFVSTSLDRTIKVFDFTKPSAPEVAFNTSFPVWKAKFAPFGDALLTIPYPQIGRIEHSVTLWNTNDAPSPVHNFLGHTDLVLDFCARNLNETGSVSKDDNGVQLYSLSKDHALRLWTIDSKLQSLCGQKLLVNTTEITVNSLNYDEFVETFERAASLNDSSSSFLINRSDGQIDWDQEINILRSLIVPNITIDEVDSSDIDDENRSISISVDHRRYVIKLTIGLPTDYSKKYSKQLRFQFSRDTNLSNGVKAKVLKQLQDVCQQQFDAGQSTLEACLRRLPKALDQYLAESESLEPPSPSPQILPSPDVFTTYINSRVPFPATCGARFCSVGILVCFGRVEAPNANVPTPTPRSYTSLLNHMREPRSYFTVKQDGGSLKSFYYPTREMRTPRKKPRVDAGGVQYASSSRDNESSDESCSDLMVYDLSSILPYSRELAKNYSLDDDDVSEVCLKNSLTAATYGRKDLVKIWKVLSHCTDKCLKPSLDPDLETPWAVFPFGRQLINRFIDHYCRLGDIQTAAMICCVLGSKPRYHINCRSASRNSAASESLGGPSTYNTIHNADGIYEALTGYFQRQRSGSFTEEAEMMSSNGLELLLPMSETKTPMTEQDSHDRNVKLLNPDLNEKYETIKQAYAEILYRWNMLNERADILKYSFRPPERSRGIEYVTACRSCGTETRSALCTDCKTYAMICCVCKEPVKGLSSVCSLCSHGGHMSHLAGWFRLHDKCPSGCGCSCLNA